MVCNVKQLNIFGESGDVQGETIILLKEHVPEDMRKIIWNVDEMEEEEDDGDEEIADDNDDHEEAVPKIESYKES